MIQFWPLVDLKFWKKIKNFFYFFLRKTNKLSKNFLFFRKFTQIAVISMVLELNYHKNSQRYIEFNFNSKNNYFRLKSENFIILGPKLERWNSKGRSGYSFDSIYKIYFAAFLHRTFEVLQIWLTHQSKSSDFLFWSLQSFDVRKRQNKFCKLSQNCNLSALLNFTSLIGNLAFYPIWLLEFKPQKIIIMGDIITWRMKTHLLYSNFSFFYKKT